MTNGETLGGRILRARLALGGRIGRVVTQAEVGKRMGVTGVTVGSWESDAKEPANVETLRRLAEVLEVRAAWLAFGDGEPSGVVDSSFPRTLLHDERPTSGV